MKKMLGMLSAIGLLTTTSIATVSCNPENQVTISKYEGLTSIKNVRIWRSSEPFLSLEELKTIISSSNENGDQDNNDKQYAISRLKALAADNFMQNKFECWNDLQDAKLNFYKEVPVSIVNPLGYSKITEDDFKENSDVDLRFIKFEFEKTKDKDKQVSAKLDLRTLTKFTAELKEGSNLKLHNVETDSSLRKWLGQSIVNIFDRHTPSIVSFLSSKGVNKVDDIKDLEKEIKESSKFNNLLKSIASYLSEVVKLVNSESGIIKFDNDKKEFSYTPRRDHILEFLQKEQKDKVFEILKQMLFKEKDQINYIDILDGFVFDKKSDKSENNKKEILTTIKTKDQKNNG
ncbi:Hypothetical protein, predicted lipoprotein [Mycoplasma yeatsii 13926]|uniref:Lipoprotein n=1 Tax=Mycoplasma yeatsii 13926 TaxID=1188240 RepID=S6G3Q6_9MOLU|nr:hypothetical protein [Mycoplasma yeatsii]EOA07436.1 Hypothetical protein, predicted lipoprotein [Mycoplasma yeatsii 13926]